MTLIKHQDFAPGEYRDLRLGKTPGERQVWKPALLLLRLEKASGLRPASANVQLPIINLLFLPYAWKYVEEMG
jgi:hypothetical protein